MRKLKNRSLRKLVFLSLHLISVGIFAQSPYFINYQGTARLADGTPLESRTIRIQFSIRQTSSSGSIIATETQQLQTNALGLFSTQIGKTANLANINWQGNAHFLEVGIDTSGGSNFVILGAQQMVSVPYAMHANSVPSSYIDNILSIGDNSYALSPTVAIVPNTSITVSGLGTVTSVGTNTFDINIPTPTFSNTGQAIITGTYPDFIVNTPTVPAAITPSITLTNTASLASTVTSSGSSFSLNIPPPTFSNTNQTIITGTYPTFFVNTPTVGATPNTTITPSGLVTVSNLVTNSFVVGVPPPTLAIASGSISITGGNSVPLPAQTSVSVAGIATLNTSGSNYTVGVPAPTLAIASGSISITGGNSVPLPTTPTVSAAGIATVSAGPNYLVGVPAPTLAIASGSISITGGNSVPLPTTPTVSAAGIATVSAGPNYLVGVPAPTLAIASGSISITGGNSVPLPTTPTVSAAGIATVSAGPNYLVGVQAPVFTNASQNIISGAYPAYTVNTPTIANTSIALTATAAAGPSLSTSGTNSFNINIPPTTAWSLLGNATTNPATNYIGTSDAQPLIFRSNATEAMRILANGYVGIGTPTPGHRLIVSGTEGEFQVHPYFNGPGATALMASLVNSNSRGPQFRFQSSGAGSLFYDIGKDANGNFVIENSGDVPVLTINQTAAIGVGSTANYGTAGQVLTSSGSAAAPIWTIVSAVNSWSLGGNTATTPSLNFIGTTDNNALNFRVNNQKAGSINQTLFNASFGHQSLNAVTTGSGNIAFGSGALQNLTTGSRNVALGYSALSLNNSINNIAIGASALAANTSGNSNVAIGLSAMGSNAAGNYNTAVGHAAGQLNSGFQNVFLGYSSGAQSIGTGNVFLGYQSGFYETGNDKLYIANSTTSVSPLIYGDFSSGNVSIGTSNAHAPLQFSNGIQSRKIVLWEGANNDHQFYGLGIDNSVFRYQVDVTNADHVFYAGTSATTSNELFRIKGNGYFKMGSETGTGQPPNYPVGAGGMMIRRLYTTNITAGEIIARTADIILERDGTNGGWRVNNTGISALSVCNCMGTNSAGAAVNRAFNNLVSGITQVYNNTDNIVFLHCIFGDPYFSANGHITEVSLTRQSTDYFWIGTVMSTFNQ
ncbi:beta strand repeat-containing protein [Aurantibacillus circumpalustris]|uniref:beta strand repeat-containing protein n=1 Tax=Aurantibacillus circumpalustris TaxID=3036359 RepID=UPI00295B3872|nr:hypothetical protein [Aurantibacillus circumpalustris]